MANSGDQTSLAILASRTLAACFLLFTLLGGTAVGVAHSPKHHGTRMSLCGYCWQQNDVNQQGLCGCAWAGSSSGCSQSTSYSDRCCNTSDTWNSWCYGDCSAPWTAVAYEIEMFYRDPEHPELGPCQIQCDTINAYVCNN